MTAVRWMVAPTVITPGKQPGASTLWLISASAHSSPASALENMAGETQPSDTAECAPSTTTASGSREVIGTPHESTMSKSESAGAKADCRRVTVTLQLWLPPCNGTVNSEGASAAAGLLTMVNVSVTLTPYDSRLRLNGPSLCTISRAVDSKLKRNEPAAGLPAGFGT